MRSFCVYLYICIFIHYYYYMYIYILPYHHTKFIIHTVEILQRSSYDTELLFHVSLEYAIFSLLWGFTSKLII